MPTRAVIYVCQKGTRGISKRVPATFAPGTQGYGFTSIPDGSEEYLYEVSVDLVALRLMASKAANNKSGLSNDGPLRVRITSRRRIHGNKESNNG